MTACASKGFRTFAAVFWVALAIPAAGCGGRSSRPVDATTASSEELHRLVGKQITIQGKFSLRGKFGPFILLSNDQIVYLVPKGSFAWGKTSEMEGKLVKATGTLNFFQSPDSKSVNPAMARAVDYFYFEAETAELQPISH